MDIFWIIDHSESKQRKTVLLASLQFDVVNNVDFPGISCRRENNEQAAILDFYVS